MTEENSNKIDDQYQDFEMGNGDIPKQKPETLEQKPNTPEQKAGIETSEIEAQKQTPTINHYQNRPEDNSKVVDNSVSVDPTDEHPASAEIVNEVPPQRSAETVSVHELKQEMHIDQSMQKGKTIGEVKTEYIYKKGGNRPTGNVLLNQKKAAHARKKAALGCIGGVIFMLFILLVFSFIFVSNSTDQVSPMSKILNVNHISFVNGLITTVHVIFITFALISFVFTMAGVFRSVMARKTEVDVRKSGIKTSIISGVMLFIIVIAWMFSYVYLDSKRLKPINDTVIHGIITTPEKTLNQLAPISIKFDASALPIDDKKYEIISYHWDFGDEETSNSKVVSHKFTEVGTFDILLTVVKRDKKTDEQTEDEFKETVSIASQEMAALFTMSTDRGEAPLKVEFDASKSIAPDSEIIGYEWDFDEDGEFNDADGTIVEFEFEKIGRYDIELRIKNTEGKYALITKQVIVDENLSPTAVITVVDNVTEFKKDIAYVFKADDSTPSLSDSKIVKYEWSFGTDNTVITTKSANYTFDTEGKYEITLKIIDEEGKEGEVVKEIVIGEDETAPDAVIAADSPIRDGVITGEIPLTITFNAQKSTDIDDNIVDYEWDFDGDGTADQFGEMTTYKFDKEGDFTVNLRVIDADGNSGTDAVQVKTNTQGITAKMEVVNGEGSVPLIVSFNGSKSSYDGGQISNYEWNFGDGTAPKITGSVINHKYSAIGTYEATLKVTGIDGKQSTTTANIVVREIPLQACFTSVFLTGVAPLETALDPSCSTGTVAQYFWTFGDGGTSTQVRPIHNFTDTGVYDVQLEVTDSDGTVSTTSIDITVTAEDAENTENINEVEETNEINNDAEAESIGDEGNDSNESGTEEDPAA